MEMHQLKISGQIFGKHPNIEFHENPTSGAKTDGQTGRRTQRQTDITKLIVAFRNFEKALKSVEKNSHDLL
jgi:hypothetical protein